MGGERLPQRPGGLNHGSHRASGARSERRRGRGTGSGRPTIVVHDDGSGIPDIELDALAAGGEDPLQHGSGLGLWMVRWLADRIGATVEFDTEGEGTRATVTLPG